MAAPSPPTADTKKPATPPPSKQQKAAGGKTGANDASGKQPGAKDDAAKAGQGNARTADKAEGAQGARDTGQPGAGDKATAASQQRFDRMAVRAKLAVSEPGDAVEREADAIADKVLPLPEPSTGKGKPVPAAPEKKDEFRRKEEPKPAPGTAKGATGQAAGAATVKPGDEIRRKESPAQSGGDTNQSAANQPGTAQELIERLGSGEALDDNVRAYFEKRMGTDFGNVRIHADAAAAQSAKQLNARAFTYGSHIAFATGAYSPQGAEGKRLLAHELAHVMQQDQGSIARTIMRAPAAAAGSGDFEVSHAELEVPPIKSRHIGGYRALAGKSLLKRKGAYDASTRGTKQVALWTGGVKIDFNKFPSARRPSASAGFDLNLDVKGGASAKVIKAGNQDELTRLLQIPTWDAAGADVQFQVDHMVEYQLGGADDLANMELLNQAHNGSVGSSFSHGIKRTVREEIQKDPQKAALKGYSGPKNAAGDPTAEGVMEAMTVVFKKVKGRARESKRKEGGSVFWSKEQIEALDHVLSQLGGAGNLKGDANDFALLSPTGNLLIARLHHGNGKNNIAIAGKQAGGMAGFKMKRLVLNPKYNDATLGANIGTLEGELNFGPKVAIPPGNVSVGVSQAKHPGEHSGKVGSSAGAGLPNEVDFKPMSPLALSDITFGKAVYGKASLKPNHPALSGVTIPAQIMDGRLGLFYTLDATTLAGKLKIPGVKIDSAGVTLGYDGENFSIAGGTEFTIQKFGTGFLDARTDSSGDFELEGGLRADKRLFDQADMKLWYRKKGGFGGMGTLAITTPGKIKGIKSARLTARYEDSVFSAEGSVVPDIPGLKSASLSVTYGKDQLEISGKLAIDDKVPGIEKADITVTVTQTNEAWKVAASGDVTPRLPGLKGATLKFSYDDGFVLVEGEFDIDKGPLKGKVMAGVTNAAVDEKTGKRSDNGAGSDFRVFGAADIKAEFIKDKLDGTLKLRLLPDGSVRVGGGLEVKDFEVFGKIPKDGGTFLDNTISSPEIPVPGLGFSVGSLSVGLTLSASITAKANAAIGPSKMSGITVTVAEFDPAKVDFNTLEIGGGASFLVFADAGFSVTAKLTVKLSALVASLEGSPYVRGSVGIPADKPILKADSKFTYSQANGLDIMNTLALDISPELKFSVGGELAAKLNLLVTTVTLWSDDWTIAEASYKLPIGITASGSLGYNSKTGKLRPEKPSDAIDIDKPKLDSDTMKSIVMGDAAPPKVKTLDEHGKELSNEERNMCTPVQNPFSAPEPNQSVMPAAPNQSVMPQRDAGAAPAPEGVDENIVGRLGPGMPLDLATRGYFEQRMKVDLTQVRIHVGPTAAREVERLSARAFTVGEHIAFAPGAYDPNTPDGQELIAHELAHIAQMQGGGAPIVLRWPAVTRTDAHTAETPATIRARDLSGFVALTESQRDWATSPALQGDPPALGTFRDIRTFADGPNIQDACSGLNVGDIVAKGVPAVYPALRKYTDGVSGGTAWLRWTDDTTKAERWGGELTSLEAAWPAANLSLVMKAPDPVSNPSPFERLEDPASPELPNFISYLSTCDPILSADDGSEVDSFLSLRAEGGTATAYTASVTHVTNYHHFTKNTLEGLARNEAVPQWEQNNWFFSRPMTAVLYPTVDHNGAFHRNRGLEGMVTSGDILTIVLEGHASVADYTAELAPVAARYGENGEIQQVMIGGHGNTNILQLAGSMSGNTIAHDSLGTSGTGGANTTALMAEIVLRTGADPARRRIVLDACLTNSHLVQSPLNPVAATAASEIQTAITANPSLRDFMAGSAGAGAHVFGSNSSFVPAQTTFLTPGTTDIGLSVPGDPDLIADKLTYVEFGTEPEGCMRAMLEAWSADQRAGTHACRDAVRRRIAAGNSGHVLPANRESWREAIIQPLYDLAVNHYWGNGEALRQFGFLAGALFELKWANNTNATTLATRLGALGGNAAHVDRLLGSVAADPRYAGSARIAIVIEQAWMQHRPARRAQFLTALGRYGSCNEAVADVQMGLVMAEVPALLALPPPAPPPADQLRLALLAAHHAPVVIPPPSPLPAHADFLNQLLGAGPNFPPGLGITAALGGLRGGENGILTAIGKPVVGGGAPPGVGPAPAANVNLGRADAPDRNDFRVTPLRRNGLVATVRDNLNVRRRPTTGSSSLGSLAPGSAVFVIGEYGDWYAIEQPNATGFVAKRYVTLLP